MTPSLRFSPHEPLRVGVVGTGAMGRHHVRHLATLGGVELVGLHDIESEVAAAVAASHGCRVFDRLEDLAERVEAVVLAVPTVSHAPIGCRLLECGAHLLVEKPLAGSLAEADQLIAAAAAADRVLAVGHIEFFNPALRALLALDLPPGFVEVHRLSRYKPRSLDVDVILDLMIHDLQILHALDPSDTVEIRATGINVLTDKTDIANVRIVLASGCVANLTASRVSGEPVRKLRAFLPSRYYSLDFFEREVKGYRLVERDGQRRVEPHDLEVAEEDAMRMELEAFVAACRGEAAHWVDGAAGRRALATALEIVDQIESGSGAAAPAEESG